jgi:sec-independent protein translocase protein TatA
VHKALKSAFKEKKMFGSLGIWEILLIVLVIAVLFGGKKLPQLGKGLGEGIKNFKNSLKRDPDKDDTSTDEEKKKSNNETNN